MKMSLARRVIAEFIGTAFLVAAVIGSGVMGDRLANGNIALALLANTIATGAALVALIFAFGGISGAHFNPVVSLMDAFERGLPWNETPQYVIGQIFDGVTEGRRCPPHVRTPACFLLASCSERHSASIQ